MDTIAQFPLLQEGVVKGTRVGWGEARTPPEPVKNGGIRKLTPLYKKLLQQPPQGEEINQAIRSFVSKTSNPPVV